MQHDAADQLHIEMALTECALGRLAHGGKGVDQEIVERLAFREPLFEPIGAGAKLGIAQPLELRFFCVDERDRLAVRLDNAVVRRAEQPPDE